jgi:hypothetical protein
VRGKGVGYELGFHGSGCLPFHVLQRRLKAQAKVGLASSCGKDETQQHDVLGLYGGWWVGCVSVVSVDGGRIRRKTVEATELRTDGVTCIRIVEALINAPRRAMKYVKTDNDDE